MNPDPSRKPVLGAAGIPAVDHGDRAVPPDSVDGGDSRNAADGVGLARGNAGCNSVVRDHSADRQKTSHGSRCPRKLVALEQLRHEPPSALAGGARQRRLLRGTLEPDSMWVPDEGCHTGTPSLTTAGFLLCFPPSTSRYNFNQLDDDRTDDLAPSAQMMFFPHPFRKLRFQMIVNMT